MNLSSKFYSESHGLFNKNLIAYEPASGLHYYKGATSLSDFMFNSKDIPEANTEYTFDYFIIE